jgi:hypothetical protein
MGAQQPGFLPNLRAAMRLFVHQTRFRGVGVRPGLTLKVVSRRWHSLCNMRLL